MTTEAAIQTYSIRYAKQRGCLVRRLHMGYGAAAGWPDVLFLPRSGSAFFIEFKAPGKKPTPLQRRVAKKLERHGYFVSFCDSKEQARRIIDERMGS